ncbi:Beta-hexosaminidase [Paraconexibacter sp. AEG42_29]|uniref:Beta-hexosaminidase n=1 Tax=Paraconexibacter sp. AEG42_29 TaxID=2997339 RepID=A0AAU7B0V9_9ACTN
MVPHVRRRVAALALLLLVTVGIIGVAIVGTGSGDDTPDVPEGGSSFAVGDRKTENLSLLDALAPLLAAGTPTATSGATPTGGSAKQPERPRSAGAPVTAQEVAQLFMVGFRGRGPDNAFFDRLALRRWGAVILDGSNYADELQFTALASQAVSTLQGAGSAAPLVVADQGGGDDNTLPGVGPAAQPSIGSRAEGRAEALRAGRQLRRLGVRMVVAPSADIGHVGAAWDGRAFSDDVAAVRRRAGGAVRGWRTAGLAPAVGHFPGEGGASQDPADGPATVGFSLPELKGGDLKAFGNGLLPLAPALVVSNALYAAYDGVTPATLLPEVPALARRMGFRGVVVSGNLAVTVLATGGTIADAAVDALKAGCDLLWIPGDAGDQEAAYRAVVRAVRTGAIPRKRVRSALAHVTALKRKYAAAGT